MIVDCIADLHGHYPELEGGDLLIIAGDLTARDTEEEYIKMYEWLRLQDYDRKIIIAGNHDNWMQKNCDPCPFPPGAPGLDRGAEYLCDSGTEFEGLKIWGSPWTTTFEGMNPRCKAFTVENENELTDKFEKIPQDVDILITHSPPYGILDEVTRDVFIEDHQCDKFENVGSLYLYFLLKYTIRPKLHVFGHIHEGYGVMEHFTSCKSVNASHVNERYEPVNKPVRVIL